LFIKHTKKGLKILIGSYSSIVSSQVVWNFCNYLFCDFYWGGTDSVWVYEKRFENQRNMKKGLEPLD